MSSCWNSPTIKFRLSKEEILELLNLSKVFKSERGEMILKEVIEREIAKLGESTKSFYESWGSSAQGVENVVKEAIKKAQSEFGIV